jgi:hypothetical protein
MGAARISPGQQQREERERRLKLKHKFSTRITKVKFGKQFLVANHYTGALKHFLEYMHIMAEVKEVDDIYQLHPKMFNQSKDITEMLMISHLFFEMAKIYDAIPKFHDDCRKCLQLFVLFSANQPFQVVNSEMCRKNIKKRSFKLEEDFRLSYQQIYVQSKKCYVVTFCLGDAHPVTHQCREFKDRLLEHPAGFSLVRTYYRFSSVAVERWGHSPWALWIGRHCVRPLLLLFSKTVLPRILK